MNNVQIRNLVSSQVRLQHPEYTNVQLERAVDEVLFLMDMVDEYHLEQSGYSQCELS